MERRETNAIEDLTTSVLAQVGNPSTRAMYRKALADFLAWWHRQGEKRFDDALILGHVHALLESGYAAATINQRLVAIRKLAGAAVALGLLNGSVIAGIGKASGGRRTRPKKKPALRQSEAEALINSPSVLTTKGVRDRALLAVLIGCGLRRAELVNLLTENVDERSGRWFLIGVSDSRGHSRDVLLPAWATEAVTDWIKRARLKSGPLFRAIDRRGIVADRGITVQSVLWLVAGYGREVDLDVTPEDLRRTCASLCRQAGGELEQIQLMLGHASIQTTERLLHESPRPIQAPNTRLRLNWRRKLAS